MQWPRRVAGLFAVLALALSAGAANSPADSGGAPQESFVGLIGDVSCDFPPIAPADSLAFVRLGLKAIRESAPAQLLVTSVRSNAATTAKPRVVTIASDLKSEMPRKRDLAAQVRAVRLAPLVRALTTAPDKPCGTDLINAIRVLRDAAAGGTDDPVPGPMTIAISSNGVEAEPQFQWPSWYRSHRGTDPATVVKRLMQAKLGQDLHGVQIIIVGLGRVRGASGEASGVSNQEYQALRHFWISYVAACGGEPVRFVPTISMLVGGTR